MQAHPCDLLQLAHGRVKLFRITTADCAHLTWQMLPREVQQQPPLTPHVPQCHRQGCQRLSNDPGGVRFGRVSTCPVHGLVEKKDSTRLAEEWGPVGSAARKSHRRSLPKLKAPPRSCSGPRSVCSTNPQAFIQTRHSSQVVVLGLGVFTTSFRSLVCIKSSLISSE